MNPTVTCRTGTYIGMIEAETKVCSFKGIAYAEPPIGKFRWKAPIPAECSSKTFDASHFGKSCPQTTGIPDKSMSEDCLSLNIWTKSLNTYGKAVMVFFHGGSYAGGTSDFPVYNGQYLADNFNDIIIVSCNYRLNLFGFIDFSNVKGGDGYKDSPYLGILDCQMALKWIQQNIEFFGGDPSNVTIFGESAGGGIVSLLMTADTSKGLFRRVIAQSGSCGLSFNRAKYRKNSQAEMLLSITGCRNMYELTELSTQEILKAMHTQTDRKGLEGGSTLSDLNNFPLAGSGSIIPNDLYSALKNGWSKDTDLIIGTTEDEFRMWITEQRKQSEDANLKSYYNFIKGKYEQLMKRSDQRQICNINKAISINHAENDAVSEKYPHIWDYTYIENEDFFRLPAIKMAEARISSDGTGKTYMYLWGKHADILPYLHAAHAAELPYVFMHHKYNSCSGNVNKKLALMTASSWVQFAKSGSPDTAFCTWQEYNLCERNTMYFSNDNQMQMVCDPYGRQRALLSNINLY